MPTILQVSGMVAITVGVTLFSLAGGLIVGGVFLILAGVAQGRVK